MGIEKRSASSSGSIGTGPYLAKVIGHLDPTIMGGLEVTLLRTDGNSIGESTQTYPVKYASPFFGNTAFEFMGLNAADYNDTQKSYGMWFVPPDVGNTVLVVFIDGRADAGFWIGCVPGRFINNMVPGIAASEFANYEDGKKDEYDVDRIPVAEINRRANDLGSSLQIDKIPKAVHPFADHLLEQGLLEDSVRGITTSSARRGVPSTVFGISTPGPLDRRSSAKKSFIGKSDSPTRIPVPVSRMGGSTIVFDDGDDRFQRRTPASSGPPEYVDLTTGFKGIANLPRDEHVRIRTRTGHQILLHNSEDLIYIGNSRGTAWIELTSDGKIDVFAEDSISVHTKQDFNFYADRDINLEAGRNVNIKASAEYSKSKSDDEKGSFYDVNGFESGRVQVESAYNMNLLIGRNGKIHCRNNEQIQGNLDIKVLGNMRIAVQDKDQTPSHTNINEEEKIIPDQSEDIKGLHIYSYENTRLLTKKNLDIVTEENLKIKTNGNMDLNTDGKNAFTAGDSTDILSGGNHTETAAKIDMNGPAARAAEIAESADIADKILQLKTYPTLVIDQTSVEWKDTRYVSPNVIDSIMKRVPMHEPWPMHENLMPLFVKPDSTDREK